MKREYGKLTSDAFAFALRKHSGQVRKCSGAPYIIHPMGAARLCMDAGATEEVVVAAMLHDTLEDTDATPEELEVLFGYVVRCLVESASEPAHRTASWRKRKQHTIDGLSGLSKDEIMVVLSDKLDNVQSIQRDLNRYGSSMWEVFKGGKEPQEWYYTSISHALHVKQDYEEYGGMLYIYRDVLADIFPKL